MCINVDDLPTHSVKKIGSSFRFQNGKANSQLELEEECTLPWEPELKLDTVINVFLVKHKFSFIR